MWVLRHDSRVLIGLQDQGGDGAETEEGVAGQAASHLLAHLTAV